jgi:hypothetical protein
MCRYVFIHCMSIASRAPRLEFARPGANPTLESIEYVRAIIRTAEMPVSRNEILRTLANWSHSMSRQSLNAAVKFLAADGSVVEGSKGLAWVPGISDKLAAAIEKGHRL